MAVRRPQRPPVRRSRPKGVTYEQQALFEFDTGAHLNQEAQRAVKASRRAFADPRAGMRGRNLRALSIGSVKEELPNFLPFESSRVAQAGYSSKSHTLYVKFVDGTPWAYYGVEPNVWRNFRRSASPGRYINRVLNNYSYSPSNGF